MLTTESTIREHLLYQLKGDGAHIDFASAVKEMPLPLQGKRPAGTEHSPWEVLEHIRIAQWDLLEYIRNPKHVSPEFPDGYWPNSPTPPNGEAWDQSVEKFQSDFNALVSLISDDKTDLLADIPHAEGQTIFRKVSLAADHTAYHLGELVLLRRILGAWK